MNREASDFSPRSRHRDKYGSITVYGKADGDYFVFYSYDTDKEVLRVKCPVIRESEVEHDWVLALKGELKTVSKEEFRDGQ